MTPVLMYHALVRAGSPTPYVLSAHQFTGHLDAMLDAGRIPMSLKRLLSSSPEERRRAIVITFDDGSASDAQIALPILKSKGATATFFVTTGHIGTGGEWMRWDDVKDLHLNGMEVAAHGHTHRFLDDLAGDDLASELRAPVEALGHSLGIQVQSMSFPGGRFNSRVIAEARRAGYLHLSTSEPALFDAGGSTWRIPRILMRADTADATIGAILSGDLTELRKARIRYWIGRSLKKALGNDLYHRLWMRSMAREP